MNYLKQTDSDKTWILDIESDSLTPTKIWVVVVKNLGTEEEKTFYNKEEFNAWLHTGSRCFIGHNILSFDIPVLNRLWGSDIALSSCCCSLTLSYLYNPALAGGHSLDAWGQRLGFPKQDFSDFSRLSDTMVEYCRNDVRLTYKLYKALTEKMLRLGYSELSAEIEHKIRIVIDEQQRNGFWFDKVRGLDLLQQLRRKQSGLTEDIQRLFPPVGKLSKTGTFKRNKDGGLPAFIEKARNRYDRVVLNDNGYEFYSLEPFNIGSPQQRVSRLLEMAWEPQKFTKKGFPQVDEEALVAFSQRLSEESKPGAQEVSAIAEWLVLQGRSSMIETWLGNLGDDSRIHGTVMTCGATTRRMTHSSPNCVPMYSQALTRNGWKSYHELKIGEDILAYDMSTKTKKWTPLLALSAFPEAEIYSFGQQHPRKRLYCTKNHSWVVRDRDCKGYKDTEKLVEAQFLKHNRPIKINAPFENDVLESNFSLIQKKYDHDWVAEICKKSDAELNAMMQGFLLADGCRHGKTWTFAQAEGHLLDAFLTCFYLISNTRISACQKRKLQGVNQRMGYNVVQTSNTFMRTKDMSLRFEELGPVWCPTTQYGTWVMKQGDFITITGNTANIPSGAKARYGHECRSLWSVAPGSGLVLVGYDAAGLETAGLCHYLNNPRATDILLRPKPDDIHTANASRLSEALGWPVDREWGAKTSWYAWLYGAYPPKLGSIVSATKHGWTEQKAGEVVIDTFFRNVPGLKKLIQEVQNEFQSNHGLLRTIDDGFVRCPSLGASLNYKIQSAGAIVMKLTSILLDEEARKQGIPFKKVGDIHDEGQLEVDRVYSDRLGALAVASITRAGELLGFNVPLSGDYKIGKTWAETH